MEAIYHPAFGGVINAETHYIPDDPDGQVGATIDLMRRYALEDAQSPEIQAEARRIRAANPGAGQSQLATAAWSWVKSRVTFTEDSSLIAPTGWNNPQTPITEALIRPKDMVRMCEGNGCKRVGDCDDFSMYVVSLLTALGINAKFVTVAADPANPDVFSHVYVAAYPDDGPRIALDASHGTEAGWETKNHTRIEEWPLGDPSRGIMTAAALVVLLYYVSRGGIG